jgi:hypothetical protein
MSSSTDAGNAQQELQRLEREVADLKATLEKANSARSWVGHALDIVGQVRQSANVSSHELWNACEYLDKALAALPRQESAKNPDALAISQNKLYYEALIRLKATGAKVMSFNAPCCGKVVETQGPVFPDSWKIQENCPHCSKPYFITANSRQVYATPA